MQVENRPFIEKKFFYADPDFLRVFTFPLVAGEAATALSKPFSVVLTESTAKKYFGKENPIGRAVRIGESRDYLVTGVLADVPGDSHLTFDLLASYSSLDILWEGRNDWKTGWFNNPFTTYLRLRPGTDPGVVDQKLQRYSFEGFGKNTYTFHLQPLTEIHFRGHYNGELEPNGDVKYLYIFSAIAAFLMIIACSNFVNLSTARSSLRAKEVGIRKVVGAGRSQLIGQFLGEALLLAGAALSVAVLLVLLALPTFRRLVGSTIPPRALIEPSSLLFAVGFTAGIGLLAGFYPALVLSRFPSGQGPEKEFLGRTGGRRRFAIRSSSSNS